MSFYEPGHEKMYLMPYSDNKAHYCAQTDQQYRDGRVPLVSISEIFFLLLHRLAWSETHETYYLRSDTFENSFF